jgi:sugar phosphate permease
MPNRFRQTGGCPDEQKRETMSKRFHWAWLIVTASFMTIFTYYSLRMSYSILMPEMILALRITKAQAGVIAGSFFVTYTLLTPLLGFLGDRVNVRKLLPIFGLVHGAGALLMGTASSFFEACLFFAIVGGASAGMYVPVMALIQRWFSSRHRGMALGMLSMSWTLGYALMGVILPLLVARYDWRTCWFVLSGLAFVLVPVNGILMRSKPEDLNLRPWGEKPSLPRQENDSGLNRRLRYGEILKLPNLWIFTVSYFMIAFSVYVITTFIVTYANMELKLPYSSSALLASAIAFSGMGGGFLIPMLSDRFGRKKCLILNNLLLAGSIIPLTLAGDHWALLLAASCIFGFFFTASWPMYAAAAGDFFPRGATGSVLGVWGFFYGMGVMLGPTLGGYLADFSGTFRYPFYVAAATSALGAFFLLWVKTPPRKS